MTKGSPAQDNTGKDVSLYLGVKDNSLIAYFEGPTGADYSVTDSSNTNVADSAWHLGVVSATSGAMKLYVDGAQVGQSAPAQSPASSETNAFMVGRGCFNGFTTSCSGQFRGFIASTTVWDQVLSAGQVSQLYSTCNIVSLPAPVLDLSMQGILPAAADGALLSSSYEVPSSVGSLRAIVGGAPQYADVANAVCSPS